MISLPIYQHMLINNLHCVDFQSIVCPFSFLLSNFVKGTSFIRHNGRYGKWTILINPQLTALACHVYFCVQIFL